jgi:hypothetical protein
MNKVIRRWQYNSYRCATGANKVEDGACDEVQYLCLVILNILWKKSDVWV